ncbi:hypothetical protein HKX48_000408 [Thoreauomyces humboldtii]|nr:hypothetical protein HKX48_000408 [Thoreauomyces humboldtii]
MTRRDGRDSSTSPTKTSSPSKLLASDIRRPEPAVAAAAAAPASAHVGAGAGALLSGEVRRVWSLGALSAQASLQHLGFGRASTSSRSISVGSSPQLIATTAHLPSNDSDLDDQANVTSPDGDVLKRSPTTNQSTDASSKDAAALVGIGSPPSATGVPATRRPSATRPRSVLTRDGDSVAEAAVALLASADGEDAGIASKKRNSDFHELFPTLPRDDLLVEDYSCAWQKEVLIQGRMYLSQRHVCFYANLLGWVHSAEIPFTDIVSMDKKYVAAIIPNSLEITTSSTKYFFASFMHRDATFSLVKNLWDDAANKTFQLKPITTRSAQELRESVDGDSKEDIDDRGRDLEVPESTAAARSLSLDSLHERLKMGGDQVKKRVAAYMNDKPSDPKGKGKGKEAPLKLVNDPIPDHSEPEHKDPTDFAFSEADDAIGGDSGTKSRSTSLPEVVLKDQIQILLNGELSPEVSSKDVTFVTNGPPFPVRDAADDTSNAKPTIRVDSSNRNNIDHEEEPDIEKATGHGIDDFSTPTELMSEVHTPPLKDTPTRHTSHAKHPIHIHAHPPHVHINHTHKHAAASPLSESIKPKRRKRSSPLKRAKPKLEAKAHVTAADCGCGPLHEEMIPVLDSVFDVPVKALWRILYDQSESTQGFLYEFLHTKRKVRDYMFHDWVPPETDLAEPTEVVVNPIPVSFESCKEGWQRRLEYVVPLNGAIGPKQTRCKLHETIFKRNGHRSICISSISRTPDVPSGTAFQSRVKLCLTATSDSTTRLRVSCEVEWLKSSWLKTPINAAVPEGLKAYHKELDAAIRTYVSDHVGSFGEIGAEEIDAVEVETDSDGSDVDEEDGDSTSDLEGGSPDLNGSMPSLSGLSHPLEKEMADIDRTGHRNSRFAERGYAQSPDRGLCEAADGKKTGGTGLKFNSSATASPFSRTFVTPTGKKGSVHGKNGHGRVTFAEWWGAVRVVVAGVGGWGVVVGVCAVVTLAFLGLLRGVVRYEVRRAILELPPTMARPMGPSQ